MCLLFFLVIYCGRLLGTPSFSWKWQQNMLILLPLPFIYLLASFAFTFCLHAVISWNRLELQKMVSSLQDWVSPAPNLTVPLSFFFSFLIHLAFILAQSNTKKLLTQPLFPQGCSYICALGCKHSCKGIFPQLTGESSSFLLGANHFPAQKMNSPLTSAVGCTSVYQIVHFLSPSFFPVGGLTIHPLLVEVRKNHVTCFGQ